MRLFYGGGKRALYFLFDRLIPRGWVGAVCLLLFAALLFSSLFVGAALAVGQSAPSPIILFESTRTRHFQTYLLDIDRAVMYKLRGVPNCANAVWSPDGRRIACKSNIGGLVELVVLDPFEHTVRQMTHDSASEDEFAWSPDGREIAFTRVEGLGQNIYVINVETGQTRQLTNARFNFSPVWSPDGRWIAYRASRDGRPGQLRVMNSRDGGDQRVLAGSSSNVSPLVWSPDGTRILFEQAATIRFDQHLAVVHVESGRIEPIVVDSYNARPEWSPDGQRIVFVSRREGPYFFYIVNADGSNLRRMDIPANTYSAPTWSPDGRQILFDSWREGASGIYVMNADGSGERRLTTSALDSSPAWRP